MKFLYVISAVVLCTSCSDVKRSGYIDEIVKIQSSIDSMGLIIEEIDFGSLDDLLTSSKEVEAKMVLLSTDTIPLELALEIDHCVATISSGEAIKFGIEMLKEEISIVKGATESLMNDISEDSGHREKYEEYIQFEKDKVDELRSILDQYSNKMNIIQELDEESISSLLVKLDERITAIEVQ